MAGFWSKFFGGGTREVSGDEYPIDAATLEKHRIKAGALYSVYNGDKSRDFGFVKILVLEPSVVHIRSYNIRFSERPEKVESVMLEAGMNQEEFDQAMLDGSLQAVWPGQGIRFGHLPIHLRDFLYGWEPVYLKDSPTEPDELEGYNMWKEAGGGVFGGN